MQLKLNSNKKRNSLETSTSSENYSSSGSYLRRSSSKFLIVYLAKILKFLMTTLSKQVLTLLTKLVLPWKSASLRRKAALLRMLRLELKLSKSSKKMSLQSSTSSWMIPT